MFVVYNLLIYLFLFLVRVRALFEPKARAWTKGQKGLLRKIENTFHSTTRVIWFHCASLGEFEQGRPVIESFKRTLPDVTILLTFFSPSGYEIRKNYPVADFIYYLPADTLHNARRFIGITRPSLAVFVKYEYWFNYMRVLHENRIPLIFISAIFRPEQFFFKKWLKWPLNQLRKADHFFVQDSKSASILKEAGIEQVTISGDTRFDRVISIKDQLRSFPVIEKFIGTKVVVVAGSTWPEDEKLLLELIKIRSDLKYLIAPHEIHQDRILSLQKILPVQSVCYTRADEKTIEESAVMIIDTIGILSQIYRYATIAYIGGGFGKGIHNILEAAVYGIPVIIGPNFQKFREAVDLVQRQGAFAISSEYELINIVNQLLGNQELYTLAGRATRQYIEENLGATDIILHHIKKKLSE